MNNSIIKIRIYTILILLTMSVITCSNFFVYYLFQSNKNENIILSLASGTNPNNIELGHWKKYFGSPENLYVASSNNYTIITENNIKTERLLPWINAAYRLPGLEINSLNINKFGNNLRISVKLSSSPK